MQTRPADEIVVVDDGSDDNLLAVLPPEIRYARHDTNLGVSAARNTGARMAAGDHLVFLDADDMLEPQAIEKMLGALEASGACWCVTDVLRFEKGESMVWSSNPPSQNLFAAILANDFVMAGIFFRRADFEDVGMYDPALQSRQDWDINIRMIEAGKPFCYLAEPVYRYYRRENSISNGAPRIVLDCTRRLLEKHHRRVASRNQVLNRSYAEALWRLGRLHWQTNHPWAAMRYGVASTWRARNLEHVRRFLRRFMAPQR